MIDPDWTTNIKDKCPNADMDSAYSNKSEIQNGIIGLGFGAYFGIIFFAKRNPNSGTPNVQGEAWWKPVVRILITGLICGVVLLPYLLLKPDTISNIYVLMIFKTFLPTFATGFLLFCGLLEYIFVKIKALEIEDNFHDPFSAGAVVEDRDR